MADGVEVDSIGLQVAAGIYDTAARVLTAAALPSVTGSGWATTEAVCDGHGLVADFAKTLAGRVTATGAELRSAADFYTGTDEDSARQIVAAAPSVEA